MTVSSRRILAAVGAGAAAAAIASAVPASALTTVTVTAGSARAGTSVAIQSGSSAAISLKDLTSTKWTLAVDGNTTSGTTPFTITGINVVVDSSSCSFNVTGSVRGSFVNGNPSKAVIAAATAATWQLVVSNLVLKNGATKCLGGAITHTTPGNKIAISGTWNKTATNAAYNPLAIVAS